VRASSRKPSRSRQVKYQASWQILPMYGLAQDFLCLLNLTRVLNVSEFVAQRCEISPRAVSPIPFEMSCEMTDTRAEIPSNHAGELYIDFMSRFSLRRNIQRYLEIGVNRGLLLARISTETAVAVDPAFQIVCNISANKKRVFMYQIASDEFFKDIDAISSLGGSPDIAFLDGMHLFEFLLRDFYNTESICDPSSIIIMHDCLPLNEAMAHRDFGVALKLNENTPFHGYWTGDVWKLVPILQHYRPDLRLTYVDCPPTGLVCVSGLNNKSTVLRDKYYEIVDKFNKIPNNIESISAMYKSINLTRSEALLSGFDHSLYFMA
jgi:hypothetical protein